MKKNRLQYAGSVPSKLVMGCEQLGGTDWGVVDRKHLHDAVKKAIDLGITVYDTADVYSLGKSEEELAEALGHFRHEAFIITKFGIRWNISADGKRAETFKDCSASYVRIAAENSLRRLKIDTIPLYFVHWPDPSTPLVETLDALEELKSEGKILNYGLSNFNEEAILTYANSYNISAVEASYNLIDRKRYEQMFSVCNDFGISRFAYGALAQGLLTGKYMHDSNFDKSDRRHRLVHFSQDEWKRNYQILHQLKQISQAYNKSMAETAIRWVLDSGVIDYTIVGVKSAEQIANNIAALQWNLDKKDIEILNECSLSSTQ